MHTWVRLRIDSALYSLQWISAIPCLWINGWTAINMEKIRFTVISEACCTISLIDSAMTTILWISAMLAEWLFLCVRWYCTIFFTESVASISKNINEATMQYSWQSWSRTIRRSILESGCFRSRAILQRKLQMNWGLFSEQFLTMQATWVSRLGGNITLIMHRPPSAGQSNSSGRSKD